MQFNGQVLAARPTLTVAYTIKIHAITCEQRKRFVRDLLSFISEETLMHRNYLPKCGTEDSLLIIIQET